MRWVAAAGPRRRQGAAPGHLARSRAKAAGWLFNNLLEFGRGPPHWAVGAGGVVTGAGGQLSEERRRGALQFCLGLPQRASEKTDGCLAQAYGRGFLKWIADTLRGARRAAQAAKRGATKQVSAVRLTVLCYKGREHVLERPAPRSVWMASRGLDEVWQNDQMVRKVFEALRLRSLTAGPGARDLRVVALLGPGGCRRELVHCADEAFDAWQLLRSRRALLARMLPDGSEGQAASLAAAKRAARALVWLRHAGVDPPGKEGSSAAQREGGRGEAGTGGGQSGSGRRADKGQMGGQSSCEDRARSPGGRRDVSGGQQTQALSSAAAVLAAIDETRVVCQQTELGGESGATEASAYERAPLRHKCGRGHILQEAAFDAAVGAVRCDEPCGRTLAEGDMRFFCSGVDCDVDICAECVTRQPASAPPRRGGGHRCPRRHRLQFGQVQGEDDRHG